MISPGVFRANLDAGTAGDAGVFFCFLWIGNIYGMSWTDFDTKTAGCTFFISTGL